MTRNDFNAVSSSAERQQTQHSYNGLAIIGIVYFSLFLTHNIWRTTFPNHTINNFALDQDEYRLLFALTFIPGIFAFTIGFISDKFSLRNLIVTACVLLGIGLVTISRASTLSVLAIGTLAIAFGFTLSYIVANSVYLISSESNEIIMAMARLKSLGPLAGFMAALVILVTFAPELLSTAATVIINGDLAGTSKALVNLFSSKPDVDPQKLRLLYVALGLAVVMFGLFVGYRLHLLRQGATHGYLKIRSKLTPYYLLNFLAGCRSAIFQAFALFILVKHYNLPLQGTALLGLGAFICSFLGYRIIGRAAHRYGHRIVLTAVYLVVAFNFVAFWYLLTWNPFTEVEQTLLALSVLFLIDSTFFGVSVITDSHLRKVSDKKNYYVGDVAIGLSLFSLAAALSAVLSNIIDPMAPSAFLMGSLVCICAIIVGRRL